MSADQPCSTCGGEWWNAPSGDPEPTESVVCPDCDHGGTERERPSIHLTDAQLSCGDDSERPDVVWVTA